MTDIVIQADNLGKKYTIGHQTENGRYTALRDVLMQNARSLWHKTRDLVQGQPIVQGDTLEEVWALKDVSFEIRRGEAVGIIGRNGAGKSTLLKILSRITEPSAGRVTIKGRVASLLEVGTGFHPELTGRENIYLNGAILGMTRWEIKRKFDEIVAFAEVEKYLDTPVKRYSSGMYVRLAFAVAAHLELEILVVDEVLAVGDIAFQKKCLGKMGDVAKQGRTLLFVSHNMGVLRGLVERGVWLDEGKILYDGDIREAISRYLSSGQISTDMVIDLSNHPKRLPRMKPILRCVVCKISSNIPSRDFSQSDEILLEIEYSTVDGVTPAGAGFNVKTADGIRVGGFNTYMAYPPPHKLPQMGKVTFIMPARQLTPGTYSVTVSLGSHPRVLEDMIENAISFTVHPADIYGTGYLLTKEDGVAALTVKTYIDPLSI